MLSKKTKELAEAIKRLKVAAEQVYALSEGFPVAERNAYVILHQIEMLEIEICDPVSILAASDKHRKE